MRFIFITGSDTGVGKTVVTVLLTRFLLSNGLNVRAVKPFCSGGRDDAEALFEAQDRKVPLDEINPWHFEAPLTPLLAARQEGVRLQLSESLRFLKRSAQSQDVVLVEGAGGLLSPLGEDFSARELIRRLGATPVVVCSNRLGAINQSRLVFSALDPAAARKAQLVLVRPEQGESSAKGNLAILTEFFSGERIFDLPRLKQSPLKTRMPKEIQRLGGALLDG